MCRAATTARIAAAHLPGSLCHQCSRERNEGDWELHSVEDEDDNVVRTGTWHPDFAPE